MGHRTNYTARKFSDFFGSLMGAAKTVPRVSCACLVTSAKGCDLVLPWRSGRANFGLCRGLGVGWYTGAQAQG